MSYTDLKGARVGRLLVIREFIPKKKYVNKGKRWVCLCDCGQETIVRSDALMSKKNPIQSCGCLRKENQKEAITTHGCCGTRIYREWVNMKGRCLYPTHQSYSYYGGRGIEICEEWLKNFEPFKKWADENGYSDELTLDRIDVNGNYQPSNCRWVSASVQSFNTRVCAKNNTGVSGVRYRADRGNYACFIGYKGAQIHIGTFERVEDAITARQKAENKYYPNIKQ